MSTSVPPVIEVDFKHHGEHKESTSPTKTDIANRLESESAKMQEKRRSLTKDDVQNKLNEAEIKRKEILEEKINTAKQLEGTPKKQTA